MKRDPFFESKKNRAIAIMAGKGMWRSIYAPPCHLLLWKMGIRIPPPPFSHFLTNFFGFSVIYTPFWGTVMWFSLWKEQGVSLLFAAVTTLVAGLLFSIAMAAFQNWRRKSNHLPEWEKL